MTSSRARKPKDSAAASAVPTRTGTSRARKPKADVDAEPTTSRTKAARAKKPEADVGAVAARSKSSRAKKPIVDSPASDASSDQSPREARRLQRIELSREQILDTAEQIFAERGYHEAGLKDVAAACEFSVGSIYTFFENKDDLYKQVLMRHSIALDAINKLAPASMPADERLVELARIQIEHAKKYPDWAALTAEISRIGRQKGAVRPVVWNEYYDEIMRFLVGVIKKGQKEGTLRPGSPTALANLYQAVNMAFVLVSALSQEVTTVDSEWSSDVQGYLDFVQDTFSTRPVHDDLVHNYDD